MRILSLVKDSNSFAMAATGQLASSSVKPYIVFINCVMALPSGIHRTAAPVSFGLVMAPGFVHCMPTKLPLRAMFLPNTGLSA
jgi:hypothetical protein